MYASANRRKRYGLGSEDLVTPEVLPIMTMDEENSTSSSKPSAPTLYSEDVWAKVKAATGATKITDAALNKYRNVETTVTQRRPTYGSSAKWPLLAVGAAAIFFFMKRRK